MGVYPSNEVSSPLFAPKLPAASFQELSSNPAAVQAVSEPSPAAGSVLLSRYFQLVLRFDYLLGRTLCFCSFFCLTVAGAFVQT